MKLTHEEHVAKAEDLLEQAESDLRQQLYDRARAKAEIAAGHAQVASAMALADE